MSSRIDGFSEPLLDCLVTTILDSVPSAKTTFLASLGRRVHNSTIRALFSTLRVKDDDRLFTSPSAATTLTAVLSNPTTYAPRVKKLVVLDSDSSPIAAENLKILLSLLSHLEAVVWKSSECPPDGLCEMLSTLNPRLSSFSYLPCSSRVGKWDAPSLPLLNALPIQHLHLSSLSQVGSRALVRMFESLEQESFLEDLNLDLVWLDDSVCHAVAEKAGRLRRLQLSTAGTKLTDAGLTAILNGCDALEYLCMDEVEGRLSRLLWSKVSPLPTSFKRLVFRISESGPTHSWSVDHLLSLGSLPFDDLEEFSVTRKEYSRRLDHGCTRNRLHTDVDVVAHHLLPKEIRGMITKEKRKKLRVLRLDYWMCTLADLKAILESCPNLETLQICIDASFTKLLGMASCFTKVSHLLILRVAVNPFHAPGRPPIPLPPHGFHNLPTPMASPVLSHALATHPGGVDDPSLPHLRDVKRFIRKCSNLDRLEWFGRHSRGSWVAERAGKTCAHISVEHQHPMYSQDVWNAIKESHHPVLDCHGRQGKDWTGKIAEGLLSLYDRECAERTRRGSVAHVKRIRLPSVDNGSELRSPVEPLTPP